MESTDLNPKNSPEAWIERLLLNCAPAELPDAGFSRRVLAALPPSDPAWWRRESVAVALAAAAGLAAILLRAGNLDLGAALAPPLQAAADLTALAARPEVLAGLAVALGAWAVAEEVLFAD